MEKCPISQRWVILKIPGFGSRGGQLPKCDNSFLVHRHVQRVRNNNNNNNNNNNVSNAVETSLCTTILLWREPHPLAASCRFDAQKQFAHSSSTASASSSASFPCRLAPPPPPAASPSPQLSSRRHAPGRWTGIGRACRGRLARRRRS